MQGSCKCRLECTCVGFAHAHVVQQSNCLMFAISACFPFRSNTDGNHALTSAATTIQLMDQQAAGHPGDPHPAQAPEEILNPHFSQLLVWQSLCHNRSLLLSQASSPSHNKLHRSLRQQPTHLHQLKSWYQPACILGMESCHSRTDFSRKSLISSSSRCRTSFQRRGSP